jgi:hypothetical protein
MDGDEVQAAKRLALEDGRETFTEIHLLLGIIDGPSSTAQWLGLRLGVDGLKKLRASTMDARRGNRGHTPPALLPER